MSHRYSLFTVGSRVGKCAVVPTEAVDLLCLLCDCGARFRLTEVAAREIMVSSELACRSCRDAAAAKPERKCGACEKKFPLTPEFFRRRQDRVGGFRYICKPCNQKQDEKKRKRAKEKEQERMATGKSCRRCEGMPWRRPKRGTCKCGERYEAEPPVTAAEIHARFSGDGLVWPKPVWFGEARPR